MWRPTLDIRYASETDPMPFFNEFIEGRASRPTPCATHINLPPLAGYSDAASLTLNEVNALPDLIALRILRFIARHTFFDTYEARHTHHLQQRGIFCGSSGFRRGLHHLVHQQNRLFLRFARRLIQPPQKALYYLGLDALHRAVFAKASVAEK